jgi:bifunctional non-homologous end joining protein LigD
VNHGAAAGVRLSPMTTEPLLPQRATEAHAEVLSVDWLFEPMWPGTRLMARVDGPDVTLSDELGRPLEEDADQIRAVLTGSVLARHAVIDGVWTAQPFVGDGSLARTWAETIASEGLAQELPDPLEAERRRALVAIDLVELDDEPLGDVPFLERRRLLESVVDEGVQLRLSPVVKHPLGGWLIGWRANGFSHYVAKHQNSRYVMGERNDDWLKLSLRADASKGLMGRLVGTRERIRRIRD